MIQPIERVGHSLADQAEEALRKQILTAGRTPGDRLNEVEIASELGVSRGPVREAMQRLARDGLVRVIPHRGTFVRTLRTDEILCLYEVRISLECTAIRLCANRRSKTDVKDLETLMVSSTAELQRSSDARYPRHLDLHQLIADFCGNDRLTRLIVQINQELKLVRAVSGSQPERASLALAEHRHIVAAIVAADSDLAEHLMRSHLLESLHNTLRLAGSPRADTAGPADEG